jgi:prepilin-type processing-associated H-X9-DG protein
LQRGVLSSGLGLSKKYYGPLADTDDPLVIQNEFGSFRFGGSHSGVCNFAMCDGSVRSISFDVEGLVMNYVTSRLDGVPFELP